MGLHYAGAAGATRPRLARGRRPQPHPEAIHVRADEPEMKHLGEPWSTDRPSRIPESLVLHWTRERHTRISRSRSPRALARSCRSVRDTAPSEISRSQSERSVRRQHHRQRPRHVILVRHQIGRVDLGKQMRRRGRQTSGRVPVCTAQRPLPAVSSTVPCSLGVSRSRRASACNKSHASDRIFLAMARPRSRQLVAGS
jgi:hypothetical protein